jgi:hypothetical protein
MTQDRTYWRAESTRRLIEEGKASGLELAVALAERLEKVAFQLDYMNADWVD